MTVNSKAAALLLSMAAASFCNAQTPPPPTSSPSTRPATSASTPYRFQKGVVINWQQRQVEVDATVVLREGLLELFACTPNTKEHESILRVHAQAQHIHAALGLIGITPGKPMLWDRDKKKYKPATGDGVDVLVQWTENGQSLTRSVWEWIRPAEPATKQISPTPWLFAGSYRGEGGEFAADQEGVVVAAVNFSSALLALPESRTDDNAELWLEANPRKIPPLKTSVVLILRPAATRLELDKAGRILRDGKTILRHDLRKLLREQIAKDAAARVALNPHAGVAPEQIGQLVDWITKSGIRSDFITIESGGPTHE